MGKAVYRFSAGAKMLAAKAPTPPVKMSETGMRKDTQLTRQKIISTAERLFAERGIDAVSLNEITRAAGQKNKSALSYHFGSKESLLLAIIEKHEPAILAQLNAYLDDLEQRKALTIESVVRAVVYPLASKLDDTDGGKYFLSILAQLTSCPSMKLYTLRPDYLAREERIMKLFLVLTPRTPDELRLPRMLQISSLLFHSLSYLASIIDKRKNSRRLCQVFTDNLVDAIVAIVVAEPSKMTQLTLAEAG
jgi:AcrR family transcriptional regulator